MERSWVGLRRFCGDCSAELQEARHNGFAYLRCPWAGADWIRQAQPANCGKPYRRSTLVR